MRARSIWPFALVLLCLLAQQSAVAQESQPAPRDTMEATNKKPAKRSGWGLLPPNGVETPFLTFTVGGGLLYELDWYDQDEASREQLTADPSPPQPFEPVENVSPQYSSSAVSRGRQGAPGEIEDAYKWRDARVIFGGLIKTKRPIIWQAGFMWDGGKREWFVRQTGLVVPVPAIWGHLWIGRSKQGTSLNRVMVGYDGWTMERFAFSDAAIPLLADGVRWMGYRPQNNLIWNLGVFADPLSKGQTFSYFEHQVAGRLAFLRMDADSAGSLVHIGVGFHLGKPTNDTLQLKSKPEATTAPNFVDTGKFRATSAALLGIEAYYRPGSWLFGSEYYFEKASSPETGDPVFHGGDIVAAWLPTGETRRYKTRGAVFGDIVPKRSVFGGGWGAVELLLRFSYIDLDAGTLEGGKYWRVTPGLNWYLSGNLRFELNYGYGVLDRFDMRGKTHFLQTRIQTQL